MKMPRPLAALTLILGGLVLAGCTQPPVPDDHFYRLVIDQPAAGAAAQAVALAGTFEVERFRADGVTGGRPIAYSEEGNPGELLEYHYHFWTESPTVMLQEALADYLRASGVANDVVTPEMRVASDYVVSGRIKRMEQVLGAPAKASVEVELSVSESRGTRLVFHGTYGLQVKAADRSPGATVRAMNTAVTEIFARFVQDLARAK